MKVNLNKMVKYQNGITLIALVITIIVLLILAGVTIATLTGDNGILSKAQDAKIKSEQAAAKEKVDLAIAASVNENGKIDLKDLQENLNQIDGLDDTIDNINEDSFPLNISVDGNIIIIKNENGSYKTTIAETNGTSGTNKVTSIKVDDFEIEINEEKNIEIKTTPNSNIENLKYTYSKDNENITIDDNGKVTGKIEGTTKITIIGKSDSGTNLETECTVTIKKPETLSVGTYVNYPVDYINISSYYDSYYTPEDTYSGKWRILDVGNYNESTKRYSGTKIISAGIPLSYYHTKGSTTSINNLTTNFFSTPISTKGDNYSKSGFRNNGTEVTTIDGIKALFSNDLTKNNGAGNPIVQAMTKEDLDKVYDSTGTNTTADKTSVKENDLLAIPTKDNIGSYAMYYLATANSSSRLWVLNIDGTISSNGNKVIAVRPVVTLKDGASITKGTDGVWNIE